MHHDDLAAVPSRGGSLPPKPNLAQEKEEKSKNHSDAQKHNGE